MFLKGEITRRGERIEPHDKIGFGFKYFHLQDLQEDIITPDFYATNNKRPAQNHNKMSVTNEEVSGPNSIAGSGSSPPTSTTTTTTPAPPSIPGSSSIPNGPSGSGSSSVTDDVVKCGYLRKLKGKKKFFVLRKETDAEKPARLEYYANEKKFRLGHLPKKSIVLKTCFNISGTESKCKHSISLHTHNDCVRIAMNNEEEMNDWLLVMNSLAGEEEDDHPTEGKLHFEHIWIVTALNKGLGSKENIIGPYRLALTSKELTLLKVGEHDGRNAVVRFPLNVIRNVSHDATFGCFFHIELGRLASTGPGQLSLKTDDQNLAQNMHLVILKAMQNYSKEDVIPRQRTYTWNSENNSMRSFHSTPPAGMNRINSMDGSLRIRTDSMSSAGRGGAGMSPPVPILTPTPSISFNSPMCSTGTDSASSSYSVDYDNNNQSHGGHLLHPELYSKSNDEDESYVPWNPGEDQQPSLNSLGSLTLPLNPDMSDYVDTSIVSRDSTSSTAQTPSSYMEMQSPMSPFDNYLPMSPAGAVSTRSNGKVSVSHSRNSSLVEENEGYVPMIPGGGHHSRSESGAGSTAGSATGLDDAYLDMDFTRKMNLSNDDMRRVSPASSESLQSYTPSSDYPLEKVSSYLTDDFDDSTPMRPMRAYSVGSRSDTNATSKGRPGKNRLEAVQETFRIRAMSVGSKNPRKPVINPNLPTNSAGMMSNGSKTVGVGPLSSSWSGSTARWPLPKFSTNNHYPIPNMNYSPSYSHAASESADSDLMELDFSKNKSKSRKRSLPGPIGSLNSTASSAGSNVNKISPIPKGVLLSEISPTFETSEGSRPHHNYECMEGTGSRNYTASAPISIQKCNRSLDGGFSSYHDTAPQPSILTRLTGTDLKKLKELDDEGAYLTMDFTPANTSSDQSRVSVSKSNVPDKVSRFGSTGNTKSEDVKSSGSMVVVRPTEVPKSSNASKFSLNFSSPSLASLNSPIQQESSVDLIRSVSSSSNISTTSNNSNSSSASCTSVKCHLLNETQPSLGNSLKPSTSGSESSVSSLSRIEESPEKQDQNKNSSGSITPQSPSRYTPVGPSGTRVDIDNQVTYAAIEHLPPVCRNPGFSNSTSNSCGSAATSSAKSGAVTYAQIDFVKSAETVSNK